MIGIFGIFFTKKKKKNTRKHKKIGFRSKLKQLKSDKKILLTAGVFSYIIKVFLFVLSILIKIHIVIFIIVFFLCLFIKDNNPTFTSLMSYRQFFNHKKNKNVIFIPLKHISRNIQYRIVLIEDCKFYQHNGIDIEAIKYAYNINKRLGFKFAGGSTITQQLSRNMFLFPTKNYFRKYLEIIISMEMDYFVSKDRILELYINYIEFGNGIYGIGRASYFYYGKSIYNLTDDEINKLLTIIPSPLKYNPNNFIKSYHLNSRYIRLSSLTSG